MLGVREFAFLFYLSIYLIAIFLSNSLLVEFKKQCDKKRWKKHYHAANISRAADTGTRCISLCLRRDSISTCRMSFDIGCSICPTFGILALLLCTANSGSAAEHASMHINTLIADNFRAFCVNDKFTIRRISYSYITVYCGIHERIASVFHCRQWYN